MNEALAHEGAAPRFTAEEIAAFQNGNYPYQYPNVNWVDETFRKSGATNKIAVEFSGGGERFRYFTMVNLLSDKGFINNYDVTDGYSTQDKYVRGNLRTNLDIDLTPTTMLKVNMLGILSEMSRPGGPTSPQQEVPHPQPWPISGIWYTAHLRWPSPSRTRPTSGAAVLPIRVSTTLLHSHRVLLTTSFMSVRFLPT